MLYVSQPLDATKNVAQPINYKIKLKQSGFKWYAENLLGFERFLSKIRDIEKITLIVIIIVIMIFIIFFLSILC